MKSKTIKLILKNRFKELLKTVEDKRVHDLMKNNTIITGGSIVSMLMKENVNDFDLYFRNQETCVAVAEYYIQRSTGQAHLDKNEYHVTIRPDGRVEITIGKNNKPIFDEAHLAHGPASEELTTYEQVSEQMEVGDEIAAKALEEEDDKGPKYRVAFVSRNAITLTHKVQLIIRFHGEAEDIHKNYDFVHCTSYWKSWDNELVLRQEALESILAKELKYVGSLYPICSIVRLRKFIARGWSINAGQILKMCYQISKLDLDDVKVLEDQMIGVDSAYFAQLVYILKEKDENRVDGTYLMTLLDKVFN